MNLQTLLANILVFLNGVIVPFLIAVAFVIFLFNAFRYFILGGSNEEDQKKARSLAFWSIAAFVIMISLWGVINLIVVDLGFGNTRAIIPDYICNKIGGNCQTSSQNNVTSPNSTFGTYGQNNPYGPQGQNNTGSQMNPFPLSTYEQNNAFPITGGVEQGWSYLNQENTPQSWNPQEATGGNNETEPEYELTEPSFWYAREVPQSSTPTQESILGNPDMQKTSVNGESEQPTQSGD